MSLFFSNISEIRLRNQSGQEKIVKSGISISFLLFGGIIFLFRGLPKQFFIWIGFILAFIIGTSIIEVLFDLPDNIMPWIGRFGGLIINVFYAIKANEMTLAAYLSKGYEQINEEVLQ